MICFPAIILFIIAIVISIIIGRMWWGAALIFGSIPLVFGIISFILCKKGYTIMSWLMILFAYICFGIIMNSMNPVKFLESSNIFLEKT